MSQKILKQGSVDCLCGFYAVMNSVSHVTKQFDTSKKKDALFAKIVQAHRRYFPEALWEGLDWDELRPIIKWAAKKYKLQLHFIPPDPQPLKLDSVAYLDWLRAAQPEGSCALIGCYKGRHINEDHWTVIERVTRTHVHMIDSSAAHQERIVPRNEITLAPDRNQDFMRIVPDETVIFFK